MLYYFDPKSMETLFNVIAIKNQCQTNFLETPVRVFSTIAEMQLHQQCSFMYTYTPGVRVIMRVLI